MPRFRSIAMGQVVLAVTCAAGWFLIKTKSWLELPPPPNADLYAHSWGFQLVSFGIFWLPFVLLAVCALLVVEFAVLRLISALSIGRLPSGSRPSVLR